MSGNPEYNATLLINPARFYDVEYTIGASLIEGKEKVTVRFQAAEGNVVAAIFGIRMIRANAER